MSEHEDWKTALNRIMDEHDAATRAARRKAEAAYRRAAPTSEPDSGPQQQAAAARDYAEKLGHQVGWADGDGLDRDPHEITGQN